MPGQILNNSELIIKENSWLAKLAAKKLRVRSVALVLCKTIHLHNCTKKDFLSDEKWLRHELCHLKQFKEQGCFYFIIKYLWESLKKGYHNNRYEVEARNAENL